MITLIFVAFNCWLWYLLPLIVGTLIFVEGLPWPILIKAVEVEDMAEVATRPPLDQVQTSPSKRSIFDLRFPFMHISYYSAMQYCQPKSVFFLHLISDHFSWKPKVEQSKLCKEPRWNSLIYYDGVWTLLLEELMIWNSQTELFYSLKHLWNWKLPRTTSNLKLISYWNSNLTGTILESSKYNCFLTETWLKLVTAKNIWKKDTRDAKHLGWNL